MIDPFVPAKATRAFDEVIRQLRDAIYRGDLRPGDRLPPERTLAAQFSVSRNMVREALRMLEVTGMIELRQGSTGGAFICRGKPEFVAQSLSDMMRLAAFSLTDLTEARVWLGATVTRVACERATEDDLRRLETNVAEAAALAATGDWPRVAVLNIEFHNLLAEATANPVLVMIQRSIMDVMREISRALGPIESDVTIRSRTKILKHLRKRDAEAAVKEMERNLNRVHAIWISGAKTRKGTPWSVDRSVDVARPDSYEEH